MQVIQSWTGGHADALRKSLRMTNESFAEHLGVGVRTVANWRKNPEVTPKSEFQDTLDTALERAPDRAKAQFAQLVSQLEHGMQAKQLEPVEITGGGPLGASYASAEFGDSDYLRSVRSHIQEIVALDNRFGGADLVRLSARFFRTLHDQLGAGTYDLKLERDLQSAAGELAEVVGWLAYDAEAHDLARKMNQEALYFTRLAGDRDIELLTLQNSSMHAASLGRPREALQIARPVLEGDYQLSSRLKALFLTRKATEALNDVQQFIAQALVLVEAGQWTAHDDLAELAGTSASEVAHFLASWKVQIPNAYRVLDADGSIPSEGMLNASYRGVDLAKRLATEGLLFDGLGHAAQNQRLNADMLKELLDERRESDDEEQAPARRAWMVRGTSVDGFNLVPEWLGEGYVSLSASQLGAVDPDAGYDELKQQVDAAYQHKSYAYRGQRLEELDRFIRQMRPGDLVLTPMRGEVYLGEVTSDAYFTKSASIDNQRRDVRWFNAEAAVDAGTLPAPVPALLQSQAYVVDLTEAYDQLTSLVPGRAEDQPRPVLDEEKAQRTLAFRPVTAEAAEGLLMDQAELQKVADLLWDRKQLIFYGPPGTGKTYLAKTLARHLTEDGAVKLVQFHPSYTYEDFFEGFRPQGSGGGQLSFKLTPGPFRLFAETAKDNRTTPYILIIDEINRANLAKVFGELYFLLEYRDEAISLQYSPEKEFTLPENLFIIGTMNTADRSIARIDTAMRRRFAFVELDPGKPPVLGLLGRWLAARELPGESALLLDALNARLADAEAAIGPSYLMRESVYTRPSGLERVWEYEIMPLLADLFYGQPDLATRYGLDALRAALPPTSPEP